MVLVVPWFYQANICWCNNCGNDQSSEHASFLRMNDFIQIIGCWFQAFAIQCSENVCICSRVYPRAYPSFTCLRTSFHVQLFYINCTKFWTGLDFLIPIVVWSNEYGTVNVTKSFNRRLLLVMNSRKKIASLAIVFDRNRKNSRVGGTSGGCFKSKPN